MTIDDFIVLAMAVPEERRDGRRTVCVAGYSATLGGMVRLYPVRPDAHLHRWDRIRVTVERNPEDNRAESWKLVDSRAGWEHLNEQIGPRGHVPSRDRRDLVMSLLDGCVSNINGERRSLGIIQAERIDRAYFAPNKQFGRARQPMLAMMNDLAWTQTKSDYEREPRLAYRCGQCNGSHDQKVLDWGAFEWMRKGMGPIEDYWRNLRLYDQEYDLFVVVGNQANQRTSFLVIGIIPMKAEAEPGMQFGARYGSQLPIVFGTHEHVVQEEHDALRSAARRLYGERVFRRDGYRCVHCSSGDSLTIDHVVPLSRGGTNHPDNLQTLCRSCNSRKGVR